MDHTLNVDALSVTLGGRRILERVSLTVKSHELVGLIGPNGAGKTTLMRAIMGLLKSEGHIDTKAPVGYVPQRQDLDWSYPMSATQLVAGAYVGMRRPPRRLERLEAIYRALDAVGMYDYRKRTIQETSGGQKQRLLLARALVIEPKLLLLDEPFTGLDHPNQDALSRLFVDLTRTGVGILMSTHDLTHAIDICHRIVMLNRKVRADGKPEALLEPGLWMDTFKVAADSALLRSLGMMAR